MNDIEVLEEMRDNIYGEMQFVDDIDIEKRCEKQFDALNLAIKSLKERQSDKKRIKELEEETDLLIGQNEWYKDYYDCESIPKSLIKEKIEELNDMIIEIHRGNLQRYTVSEILSFIRFCEELLNTKM